MPRLRGMSVKLPMYLYPSRDLGSLTFFMAGSFKPTR